MAFATGIPIISGFSEGIEGNSAGQTAWFFYAFSE
jgi:hypothetical protein